MMFAGEENPVPGARIVRRVCSHSVCNWRRDRVGMSPAWTGRGFEIACPEKHAEVRASNHAGLSGDKAEKISAQFGTQITGFFQGINFVDSFAAYLESRLIFQKMTYCGANRRAIICDEDVRHCHRRCGDCQKAGEHLAYGTVQTFYANSNRVFLVATISWALFL
jgi:hypothetical protein